MNRWIDRLRPAARVGLSGLGRRRGPLERAAAAARTLRHAVRSLSRSPGFALTSILTLGIGIGACTMIFSVVYPVLVSPLPYPEPEGLAVLFERSPPPDAQRGWVSPLTLRDWRERSQRFEQLVAFNLRQLTWTGGDRAELLNGWAVTAGYFRLFGVGMTLGRGFTEEEDRPGGARVVVISYGFWKERFGSDPEVLGRTMTLDGAPYAIVGVASPLIEYPSRGDYWFPAAIDYGREMRDFRYLGVIGRLGPGSSIEDARAELAQISRAVAAANPGTNRGWGAEVRGLKEFWVGYVRPVLLGMSVAVGLLLLIAIGNVTNLSIARSIGRQTDTAIRRALGAGRAAIARVFVTEALVLSVAGSALGVVLATWGTPALAGMALRSLPRVEHLTVDARCVVFALAAAAAAGVVLGLLSVLVAGGQDPNAMLRAGGRGGTEPARAHRVREAVLAAQVGLALALLIGATLLAQSLWSLGRVDAGFSPKDVLTFGFDLPAASYADPEVGRAFYRDVLERIRGIPGVEAAGVATPIPLEMGSVPTSWSLSAEVSDPSEATVMAHMRTVTSGYFEAMGIHLLSGRLIDDRDRDGSEPVALVNRAFVDRYLRGHDPLGVRISPGEPEADESDWITIVGVVGDVRFRSLRHEAEPEIYLPTLQLPVDWGYLVVRASGPRDYVVKSVTEAVLRVDPDLPLADVRSGEEIIARQLRVPRLGTTLAALFAVVATALAVVGILGVLSTVVAQRMREIGLRIALGARPGGIWRFVLLRGMRPVAIGLAFGLAISLAASRLLQSQVFGVSTLNLLAYLLPIVGLSIAGLLACLVPGARAAGADPVVLLRSE
jgi:putative ABC transport system permease protein